jgi:hypothetical protein
MKMLKPNLSIKQTVHKLNQFLKFVELKQLSHFKL